MKTFYQIVLGLLAICSFAKADYRQESVSIHNKYRTKHHSPALSQNTTLDKYAQDWAQKMAANDTFKHSGGKYGENIYWTSSTTVSESQAVTDAINKWYAEEKDYDYTTGAAKGTGVVGHFTQIVWKASKGVGIGVAKSKKGFYVCGSYFPPGNFKGKYTENVMKP